MNNRKQIYELEDRDIPDNFDDYLQSKKNMLKQQKREYKERAVRQKRGYLSFGQEYRNVIIAAILILLIAGVGIVWNMQNKHTKQTTGIISAQPAVTEEAKENNSTAAENTKKKTTKKDSKKAGKNLAWKVGDVVYYSGTVQYKASHKGAKKEPCSSGKAKITKINKEGTHQYHIKGTRAGNNIYGWVDGKNLKHRK